MPLELLKTTFAAFAALAAASALAQQSLTIEFLDSAEREVWVGDGKSFPTARIQSKGQSLNLPAEKGRTVFVMDKTTGNLASRPVDKALPTWKVRTGDFQSVARVWVRITHKELPVAAARVTVRHARGERDDLLDPSMNGEIGFFNLPPGELRVTVRYKTAGQDAQPVTQVFPLSLKRSDAEPTFAMSLPEPVQTIGTPPSGTGTEASAGAAPPKESPGPSPFGKIMGWLFGLLAVGGVGVAAWLLYQKNPERVADKLKDLGVQIPDPNAMPDAAPAPVAAPVKPEPPPKIILDPSAQDPVATASTPIMAPAASLPTGEARLVAESGDELPLDDGVLTVGRDVGLGLSLATESTVSRRHAEIEKAGSRVVVRDLGSTNGTYVNGLKVQGEHEVRRGDVVQFGAVRFRYEE